MIEGNKPVTDLREWWPWCFCGAPWEAGNALLRCLDAVNDRAARTLPGGDDPWRHIAPGDEGLRWMAMYVLAELDLTEHGGSVQGAWLTPRGESVRELLRAELARGPDAFLDPAGDDE